MISNISTSNFSTKKMSFQHCYCLFTHNDRRFSFRYKEAMLKLCFLCYNLKLFNFEYQLIILEKNYVFYFSYGLFPYFCVLV